MPKIRVCDKPTCDRLTAVLGVLVFGHATEEGSEWEFRMHVPTPKGGEIEIIIEYCPFCGTRLEGVDPSIIAKYMHPRMRRRRTPPKIQLS